MFRNFSWLLLHDTVSVTEYLTFYMNWECLTKCGPGLYFCRKKKRSQKGKKSIMIALMRLLLKSLSECRFLCIGWGYGIFSGVSDLKKPKALIFRSLCLCCETFRFVSLQQLEFSCFPWWGQSSGLISYLFSNEAWKSQSFFIFAVIKTDSVSWLP